MTQKMTTSAIALATAHVTILAPLTPAFAAGTDGWDLIRSVETEEIITDTSYEVRKIFPSELKDGIEQFDLTGYVVLLWADENVQEFMLISDMGFCPFCGDPEHGTALQVSLTDPAAKLEEGARITVRGALEAVTDAETTQTTRLVAATIL